MSGSTACSNHQQSASKNTWMPAKIWRVARDVQDAPKIDLLSLLTAFLARMLVEDVEDEESGTYSEAAKRSKSIIDVMHRDAIAFCKDEDNERATNVKEYLHKYHLDKEDKRRSTMLCSALNTTLLEFRNKQFGDLPVPSHLNKEELIFVSNELVGLESKHIGDHMPRSNRMPDILATSTTTLRRNYDHHKGAGFEEWTHLVGGDKLSKSSGSSRKLQWTDVLQSWDVVATHVYNAIPVKDDVEIEENLRAYKLQTQSYSRQQHSSRKRRSQDDQCGKGKRARVESGSEPKLFLLQVADEKFNLLPELRCAYYGVERLSSTWNINHSISVLLRDTKMSLRWYDAHGCFGSEEIDIIENMPIFVVFLLILQRFDERMWGISSERADQIETDKDTFDLEKELCRFELTGRRTFGCSAVRTSKASNEEENIPMFFKSSWVKCRDAKEPDIIKTAYERANKLLPENYREMVTNHIPTVIASRICNKDSTSIIRQLVHEVDASVQFTGNARARVWLITHELEVIQGLDPAPFWKVFWELIRCHYLLWKIGIAHRDISITNLMCTKHKSELISVLNDYDLAVVMDPGSRNPECDGYERAGTTSFMSVDLLDNRMAKLTRWYRHDLESFAWCLLWETLNCAPRSWSVGSLDDTLQSKRGFMTTIGDHWAEIKDEWKPFFLFVILWFATWEDASRKFERSIALLFISTGDYPSESEKIALRDARDAMKEDKEYVQQIVDLAWESNHGSDITMMRDLAWMNVKLPQT